MACGNTYFQCPGYHETGWLSASSFPLRPSLPVGTAAYNAASFAIPWVFFCPFSLHRNDSGDDKQVIRRDSRGNRSFLLGEWILRRQNYPCWASCTRQRDAQHEPSSRCSLLARAFFHLCHTPVTTSRQNEDVFTYLLQIARASPPSARAFPCTVSHIDRYGPRRPLFPMARAFSCRNGGCAPAHCLPVRVNVLRVLRCIHATVPASESGDINIQSPRDRRDSFNQMSR